MLDFLNCTFLIPFMKDSEDRITNLHIIFKYLNSIMKTNVIVVEQTSRQSGDNFSNYQNLNIHHMLYNNGGMFHKTKLYNMGLSKINTEITVCLDSDVLIPKDQLIMARNSLMNGNDYVFPFSEKYIEISKILTNQRENFLTNFNFNQYHNEVVNYQKIYDRLPPKQKHAGLIRGCPPGGCLFIKTSVYFDIGMENENFFGYSPEDAERKHRLSFLGYKTENIPGHLFHLDHVTTHKRVSNMNGKRLYDHIKSFNLDQIKNYYRQLNYKEKYKL